MLSGPPLPLDASFKDTLRCILTLYFYCGAQGSVSLVVIVWAYLTSWFHLEPFSKRPQQDTKKHNMISAYNPLPEQGELFLLLFCFVKVVEPTQKASMHLFVSVWAWESFYPIRSRSDDNFTYFESLCVLPSALAHTSLLLNYFN